MLEGIEGEVRELRDFVVRRVDAKHPALVAGAVPLGNGIA
jgi:hypothetical protein